VFSVLWRCWLGGRKGIRPVKNVGGWWRWSLVSPDGVAPAVSVSASLNLSLHHSNNNNHFMALCPGLPGWAGTRRNTHPPTILTIIQSLSVCSIYHDPYHLPCSKWVLGSPSQMYTIYSEIQSVTSWLEHNEMCWTNHSKKTTYSNNNNNHFTALCPGLPGWAGTRRNTHPPTILIIIQSLSASSIYHDP